MRRVRPAVILVLAVALALGGCTGSQTSGTGVPASPTATAPTSGSEPDQLYYLSLGDSYAAGYQPRESGGAQTTTAGFPYQVVRDAKAKGYDFTLVNLACSGATTTSVLETQGCPRHLLGPGAPDYPMQTQADAAQRFLAEHRGRVGLITISIGGNDFLRCWGTNNPASCLDGVVETIGTNLGTLLARLRTAAGPDTRIVGTTYPDLFLGDLVPGGAGSPQVASLSVTAFKTFLNPQLARFYRKAGGSFVDVTKATGGYGSLSAMTNLPPYGQIPVPVARICTLTWYCRFHDVHPKPAGHALIARLVAATLPKR